MLHPRNFARTTLPSAVTIPGTPIPMPKTASIFSPQSRTASSTIPMSSPIRLDGGRFVSNNTSPAKSVMISRRLALAISMPTQYADLGLKPSITDGRPAPPEGQQSPYSTKSFLRTSSSTMELTVVLLRFNARASCARLTGCLSFTIFRISDRLILRISSRCLGFPPFAIAFTPIS